MVHFSDEQLISRYLKGDEESLAVLIRRYLGPVYGFVKKYTGNPDDASDITQEAFVKAWKSIKRFDRARSFRTWIFTIAKRTAIDWLKKKNALPFSALEGGKQGSSFAESLADDSVSVFEQLLLKQSSRELAAAISKLPPNYGPVINLRVNDELTFQEISRKLKKPLNTVKSQYRRATVMLKDLLVKSGK